MIVCVCVYALQTQTNSIIYILPNAILMSATCSQMAFVVFVFGLLHDEIKTTNELIIIIPMWRICSHTASSHPICVS